MLAQSRRPSRVGADMVSLLLRVEKSSVASCVPLSTRHGKQNPAAKMTFRRLRLGDQLPVTSSRPLMQPRRELLRLRNHVAEQTQTQFPEVRIGHVNADTLQQDVRRFRAA